MSESRSRQELRRKEFKTGLSAEESRRKRTEQRVQIRKSARDDSLRKKRNIDPTPVASSTPSLSSTTLQKVRNLFYRSVTKVRFTNNFFIN